MLTRASIVTAANTPVNTSVPVFGLSRQTNAVMVTPYTSANSAESASACPAPEIWESQPRISAACTAKSASVMPSAGSMPRRLLLSSMHHSPYSYFSFSIISYSPAQLNLCPRAKLAWS